MMRTDFLYWTKDASRNVREEAFGPWVRRWTLDVKRGWLTACLDCQKPYPMPEDPAKGLRFSGWVHFRNWTGTTGEELGLTGCACEDCAPEILNGTTAHKRLAIAQHVADQLGAA